MPSNGKDSLSRLAADLARDRADLTIDRVRDAIEDQHLDTFIQEELAANGANHAFLLMDIIESLQDSEQGRSRAATLLALLTVPGLKSTQSYHSVLRSGLIDLVSRRVLRNAQIRQQMYRGVERASTAMRQRIAETADPVATDREQFAREAGMA